MKTKKALILLALTTIWTSSPLLAADAAAGKMRSTSCTGCHGMDGRSNNPNNPNLAGQKENYLRKALADYRDGKRNDPMMNTFAQGLTDNDIADLAAYYASVR